MQNEFFFSVLLQGTRATWVRFIFTGPSCIHLVLTSHDFIFYNLEIDAGMKPPSKLPADTPNFPRPWLLSELCWLVP